jgi:hypothetical protein
MQATSDGGVRDSNHMLPLIFPMLLLPQINHHLDFSISPQSPINLRPYPKFKGTQVSIYTQAQPQTQKLKRKIQFHLEKTLNLTLEKN